MSDTLTSYHGTPTDDGRFKGAIALLLTLSALVVAGLAYQTWRTAGSHRAATERVIADYASFAAWSYASHIRLKLLEAENPVFAAADRAPPQVEPVLLGLRAAADSVSACKCVYDLSPRFVFLIDLGSRLSARKMRDSSMSPDVVDAHLTEIRSAASSSLAKGVTSRAAGALPYRTVSRTNGTDAWVAVYAVRFRSPQDPGVIVGFETTVQQLTRVILEPAFESPPLLPTSLTKRATIDSILSAEVLNQNGDVIFKRGASREKSFAASEVIGEGDTSFVARVAVNASAAPSLVIGGLPASPVRTVLPLVSLAVALLGLAFYLVSRREIASLEIRSSLSEARLSALRAQIQPHFLFNVLNSISMLARNGDSAAVSSSLARLSELLRAVLRNPNQNEVPLKDELAFTRRYLELEQIRFDDRLTFTIDSAPDVDELLVPSLILQPFVENALVHGVGEEDGPVQVSVSARVVNRELRLEVRDSGPGLDGSNATSGNGRSGGIGIRNSRERLRQLYGDMATLDVSNNDVGGVLVVITIPEKRPRQ